MKLYKCDSAGCNAEFLPEDGMVDGKYVHERNVKIQEFKEYPKCGTKHGLYKVRRTLELHSIIPISNHDGTITPTNVIIKKDLCPICVRKIEKP